LVDTLLFLCSVSAEEFCDGLTHLPSQLPLFFCCHTHLLGSFSQLFSGLPFGSAGFPLVFGDFTLALGNSPLVLPLVPVLFISLSVFFPIFLCGLPHPFAAQDLLLFYLALMGCRLVIVWHGHPPGT